MQYPHLFAPQQGTYWGFAVALFLAGYSLVIWRKRLVYGGWLWQKHLLLPIAAMLSFGWLSVALLMVQRSEPRGYTAFGEVVWAGVLVVTTAFPAAMYLRKKHFGIPILAYIGTILLNGVASSILLQAAGLYVERPGLIEFFNDAVHVNYWLNSVVVVMWLQFKFAIWRRWTKPKFYPEQRPKPDAKGD